MFTESPSRYQNVYFGRCFIPDAVTHSVSLCAPLVAVASSRWTCSQSRCLLSLIFQILQTKVIPNLVRMKISNNPTKKKELLHHHPPLVHHRHHLRPLVHLHPPLPRKCHPTMSSLLTPLSSQHVPKPFPAPPLQLLQPDLHPNS